MGKEFAVNVKITMRMKDNETEEQARNRFYEQLWSGICSSEDFGMEFEYQDDGKIYHID